MNAPTGMTGAAETATPAGGGVPKPRPPGSASNVREVWRAAVPVAIIALIAVAPVPQALTPEAWYYFAVFAGVIAALITEPMPAAAIGLISVTLVAAFGLPFSRYQFTDPGFHLAPEAIKWALAGFSNSTVWLIFAAFVFALGYEKSGLGRRLALLLVRRLGGNTLGLGYAIAAADLLLAPFTPSNTARSAGTIYPLVRSIPALYGSEPGESANRIGSYLMWVAFATTCVTSSMFVTGLAPNVLALELVRKTTGVQITWIQWFMGFLPVGAVLLATLPYLIYRIYPPLIRSSREVPRWAGDELAKMGPISRDEQLMAGLAVFALVGWIFAGQFVDATLVALVAIAFMLLSGVVRWDDITRHAAAWNILVWFATLVVLADGLNKVGFVGWFGHVTAATLASQPPLAIVVALVALFFLIHYFFASLAAHTTAVLPVILAAGTSVPGVPTRTLAMLLVFAIGIMGILTPYATGPAPVYYGSGFIARRDFWRLGLIFGLLFLAVLLGVGLPWLRLTGG